MLKRFLPGLAAATLLSGALIVASLTAEKGGGRRSEAAPETTVESQAAIATPTPLRRRDEKGRAFPIGDARAEPPRDCTGSPGIPHFSPFPFEVSPVGGDVLWGIVNASCPAIVRSRDGGQSWDRIPLPIARTAGPQQLRLAALGPDAAVLSHAGTIYDTTDGGRSWRSLALPTALHSLTADPETGRVWALTFSVCEGEWYLCPVLYRMEDRQWSGPLRVPVTAGHWPRILGFWADGADVMLAVAVRKPIESTGSVGPEVVSIALSEDGGQTWEVREVPPIRHVDNPTSFARTKDGILYIAWAPESNRLGGEGAVTRSEDGGRSWKLTAATRTLVLDAADLPVPAGLLTAAGTDLYMSPEYGRLVVSRDRGTTWKSAALPEPERGFLVSKAERLVVATGHARVYVSDRSDGLIASRDGGRTWELLPPILSLAGPAAPADSPDCRILVPSSLTAANRDVLWAIAGDPQSGDPACAGGLWRSRDAGLTWSREPDPPVRQGGLRLLLSNGPDHLLIAGASHLFQTFDGGKTWSEHPLETRSALAVDRASGSVWNLREIPCPASPDRYCPELAIFDANAWGPARALTLPEYEPRTASQRGRVFLVVAPAGELYIHSSLGPVALYRSLDGGETWQPLALPRPSRVERMGAPQTDSQGRLFIGAAGQGVAGGGTMGLVMRSDDRGETWQVVASSFNGERVGRLRGTGGTLYPVGDTLFMTESIAGLQVSHDLGVTWWEATPFPALGSAVRATQQVTSADADHIWVAEFDDWPFPLPQRWQDMGAPSPPGITPTRSLPAHRGSARRSRRSGLRPSSPCPSGSG